MAQRTCLQRERALKSRAVTRARGSWYPCSAAQSQLYHNSAWRDIYYIIFPTVFHIKHTIAPNIMHRYLDIMTTTACKWLT